MSELGIFIIGSVVFALSVYGVVMAGGIALTRVQIDESDEIEPPTSPGEDF